MAIKSNEENQLKQKDPNGNINEKRIWGTDFTI